MKLLLKQWKDLSFWGVFFVAVFCSFEGRAQDTLRIFYNSGESKLYGPSKMDINGFLFSYELKYVDSICLNGYTDSTGQKVKNQKLSERRAATVKKYIYRIGISDTVPVTIMAKGEESDNENSSMENHRRVELILYFTKAYVPPAEEEEKPGGNFVNSNCYISAENVMENASLKYYLKGNTKYVRLEMEYFLMNKDERCYSLTARNRYPKLVKWEEETTGYWWWKRPRYVANVKAKDYEKYGIVIMTKEVDSANRKSCTVCGTDPQTEWFLSSRLVLDQVVLSNMTIRKRYFPARMEIAVPKEYVSLGRGYYLDSLTNFPIQWTVRSTRNSAPFYYAEIPMKYFDAANFTIYSYRKVCAVGYTPKKNTNKTDTIHGGVCGTNFGDWVDFSAGLQFDYRHFTFDEGTLSGYFRVPLNKFVLQGNLGFTSRERSTFGINVDYHFIGFSPSSEYKLSSNQVVVEDDWRKLTGYFGNSFTGFIGNGSNQFINEVHLGVAFWNNAKNIGFESLFFEGGYFVDFSNVKSSEKFSFRTGLRFRIY